MVGSPGYFCDLRSIDMFFFADPGSLMKSKPWEGEFRLLALKETWPSINTSG